MTFDQFKNLNKDDQEYLLWRKGVELACSTDEMFIIYYYQVDGFYMEVKYVMPQSTIMHITCFEDVDLLEPYLKRLILIDCFAHNF